MVGYVNGRGRTILWAIAEVPDGFRNVTDQHQPGEYIFGHDQFTLRELPITSVFQRKVTGSWEEFLLGFMTVILIAVLSEIVQAVLMRRTKHAQVSKNGLEAAAMVDGSYHLRNMWWLFFGDPPVDRKEKRRRVLYSVGVLGIALALVVADVFAVYLTQPYNVFSSEQQYNLRASQPIGTKQGLSQLVRRVSRDRQCVTPSNTIVGQKRQFSLSACLTYDIQVAHDDISEVTEEIVVRSWFHQAGSDHEITFGEGIIGVKTRAFIFPNEGEERRLLFDTVETPEFNYTAYLHELVIHSSIQFNCNKNITLKPCAELLDELERFDRTQETREIEFWTTDSGPVLRNVTGLVSRYRVGLSDAFNTVDNGIYALTTSAVIEEVRGNGLYSANISSDEEVLSVKRLISEEGRVAGLVTLGSAFAALLIVLVVLRFGLKPTSLGEEARRSFEEEEFVGAGAEPIGELGQNAVLDYDSAQVRYE